MVEFSACKREGHIRTCFQRYFDPLSQRAGPQLHRMIRGPAPESLWLDERFMRAESSTIYLIGSLKQLLQRTLRHVAKLVCELIAVDGSSNVHESCSNNELPRSLRPPILLLMKKLRYANCVLCAPIAFLIWTRIHPISCISLASEPLVMNSLNSVSLCLLVWNSNHTVWGKGCHGFKLVSMCTLVSAEITALIHWIHLPHISQSSWSISHGYRLSSQ